MTTDDLIRLFLYLLAMAIWFLILYVVVRAAVISALRTAGANLSTSNQLLAAQADLTTRLAKHLIAQSELMVLTARHDGVTDEQLGPVLKQLEERRADPEPAFGLPYK